MLESGDYAKALSTFGDGTGARGRPELPGSQTDRRQHPLAGTASQKAEAQAEALARALQPLADRFNPNHLPAGPGGETQSSAQASGATAQALAAGFPNAKVVGLDRLRPRPNRRSSGS